MGIITGHESEEKGKRKGAWLNQLRRNKSRLSQCSQSPLLPPMPRKDSTLLPMHACVTKRTQSALFWSLVCNQFIQSKQPMPSHAFFPLQKFASKEATQEQVEGKNKAHESIYPKKGSWTFQRTAANVMRLPRRRQRSLESEAQEKAAECVSLEEVVDEDVPCVPVPVPEEEVV